LPKNRKIGILENPEKGGKVKMRQYKVKESDEEVIIYIRSDENRVFKPNSVFSKNNKFSRKQVESRIEQLEESGYEELK